LCAIIFDLDGTLVDSSAAIVECVNYALSRKGLPLAEPLAIKRRIGTPLEEIFSSLGASEADDLVRLYRERYKHIFLGRTHLLDGVKETLEEARRRGYRLAVATTKPRYFAEPILDHLGVGHFFDAVVGAEEVRCLKPFPDLLDLAVGRLRCAKDQVLYVGDHPVDVAAARAAGIQIICVSTGFWSRQELEKLKPAAVLDNIRELLRLLPHPTGMHGGIRRK